MFCNIKTQLDNPAVLRVLALSVYEQSLARAQQKAQAYLQDDTLQFYGWVKNGIIFGICGFRLYEDKVEITHIAVDQTLQRGGIGRAMLNALRELYPLPLQAETDDDAVGFYRHCRFNVIKSDKPGRWACILEKS